MQIAITGASGFIGRQVVALAIGKGFRCRVLTRRSTLPPELESVEVVRGDEGMLPELLKGADVCLNLAGEIRDEAKMDLANVQLPLKVLSACQKANVPRLVHLSSAGVAWGSDQREISEATPAKTTNVYEESKWQGEKRLLEQPKSNVVRIALRPTIVFGEGKAEPDSLYSLLRSMLAGRYRHIGDGSGIYNLCYAGELAAVVLHSATAPVSDQSVFLLNDPVTFRRLYEIVADEAGLAPTPGRLPKPLALALAMALPPLASAIGRKFPLTLQRYRYLTNRKVFRSKRVQEVLGWRTMCTSESGVRRTVKWLQRNGF